LVPVSRKSVIREVLGIQNPADRDAGTIACLALSLRRGAHLFRVHQVEVAWQAIKVLEAMIPRAAGS
jgi:dihydropteroate synthase